MGLRFRKYKNTWPDYFFGIVFYDRKQPTLDIIIGSHIFVMFWKRRNVNE